MKNNYILTDLIEYISKAGFKPRGDSYANIR
ncbi:MAG: hypothetical protein IEMM0008_0198 [bacterium]|nr:MAG: hypothetical protein IEMM0008_0198 [bacterium]